MLSSIELATDAEISRYESDAVALAAKYGVSLESVRDAVLDELIEEATIDGVDVERIYDSGSNRALALKRYATRKAIRILFEDLSKGKQGSAMLEKATLALGKEEQARTSLRAMGWPLDTDGNNFISEADEQTPVQIVATR